MFLSRISFVIDYYLSLKNKNINEKIFNIFCMSHDYIMGAAIRNSNQKTDRNTKLIPDIFIQMLKEKNARKITIMRKRMFMQRGGRNANTTMTIQQAIKTKPTPMKSCLHPSRQKLPGWK